MNAPSYSRRLTMLIWRERLRRFGLLALGAVALAAAGVFFVNFRESRSDPTLDVRNVNATVVGFGSGSASRGAYIIHARMADGHQIDAFATAPLPPAKGSVVVLGEAHHKSGRTTYDLIGPAAPSPTQ